jgi:hypothetical protein
LIFPQQIEERMSEQNDTGVLQCKKCGEDFQPTDSRQKNCPECRELGTLRVKAHRGREKQLDTNARFDGQSEPTKPEAKRLLGLRGLKNAHVIDTVYDCLIRAAAEKSVPPNYFLFANGMMQTLASYEAKKAQPLAVIPDEQVTGELLNRTELYALYDASIGWREDLGFEEFLSIRRICKTDCFLLGRDVLQKDFAECHRLWSHEFFPCFNPDTLPPNYTQKQAIKWLSEQSELKNFLLLASRSSFKSSWSHIWLLSLILCLPDVRVLLVSETRPLARDFIGVIRSYFEAVPGNETRFQQLFAEFTIPLGDGSVLSLDCPMAHLRLPQSIESTSMDSAAAGRRFDVGLFDDPISNMSCGNDVQIQASHNKFLALLKLRETSGLVCVLGTPWAENDLYSRLITQADENEDSSWTYRIDPAFVVKPEARKKLTPIFLPTLVESDIESFLFPERLNWHFLRQEISNSPSFFLSQNLCIFPRAANADLRVTFEETVFRAHIRPIGSFDSPFAQEYMSIDRAWSVSKYADFSCVMVGKLLPIEGKTACAIVDCFMERVRESELVLAVIKMIEKHPAIRAIVMEKDKGWEDLRLAVHRAAALRGIVVPTFVVKPIDITPRAKARRAKRLEQPLVDGRLWLAAAHWTDSVMEQFLKFDGITDSNKTRKDDAIDAVALIVDHCLPKSLEEMPSVDPDKEKEREAEAEQEAQRERMKMQHAAMFGNGYLPPAMLASEWVRNNSRAPQAPPEPEEPKRDPRRVLLDKILPPGMRS